MSEKLPPKILVIEADEQMCASICNTVERYWFDVIRSNNSESALKAALSSNPNVIIVSARLPDFAEFLEKIATIPLLEKLPLVYLIDEHLRDSFNVDTKSKLIEIVYRPFTPNQLMSAIKSLLRRSQPVFQDKLLKYKDVCIDLSTYKVTRAEKAIHLGPTEFKILQLFIQSPKTIFTRQQIIDHVWGADKLMEHRTVDVHVNRLRTIMKKGENDHFIKTVRSAGYCLNLPGELS